MWTRKRLIIIFVIAFLLIVTAIILYIRANRAKCDPYNEGYNTKGEFDPKCKVEKPTEQVPSGSTSSSWIPESFPLKKGMYGIKIKVLQEKFGIDADGKFGNQTQSAVMTQFGKTEVSQTDYDNFVNPKTTTTGGGGAAGGTNFAQVKSALGSKGTISPTGDSVQTFVSGVNDQYAFRFYTNGRVAVSRTNMLKKGTYKSGGKQIQIDEADGGYTTGAFNLFDPLGIFGGNKTVFDAMADIVKQIEG